MRGAQAPAALGPRLGASGVCVGECLAAARRGCGPGPGFMLLCHSCFAVQRPPACGVIFCRCVLRSPAAPTRERCVSVPLCLAKACSAHTRPECVCAAASCEALQRPRACPRACGVFLCRYVLQSRAAPTRAPTRVRSVSVPLRLAKPCSAHARAHARAVCFCAAASREGMRAPVQHLLPRCGCVCSNAQISSARSQRPLAVRAAALQSAAHSLPLLSAHPWG